jgi:exopolyphosphatase/guanosine-5'-triphosphate,3'-diphosphate pyrophosphatase
MSTRGLATRMREAPLASLSSDDEPPPSSRRKGDAGSDRPAASRANVEVAAVDLGSHSFHMIVARIDGGEARIVDRVRSRVSLAAGLDEAGNLAESAQRRALECLERFGERIRGIPSDRVRAVGTNTLRKTRDAAAFAERAHRALGHPIETISGQEEARLVYLGVAHAMPSQRGRRLVIDIGGGSTECILGDGFEVLAADSLYMGCVSHSQRFFDDGVYTKDRFRAARLAARMELATIERQYRRLGFAGAIGCSGTILATAEIARKNGWWDDGVTPATLKAIRKSLVAAGSVDRVSITGLEAERLPVLAGGIAILEAAFDAFGVERLVPSPGALREGVLYDLMGRIHHEDARERTVGWLAERHGADPEQAARIERTALRCLEEIAAGSGLDRERAEKLLRWSARLHEIGLSVAHTGYHKHSAYLLANAHMPGFAREEQRELSAIVIGHRRRLRLPDFSNVDRERVDEVERLTLIFRVAATLHRGRDEGGPPVLRMRLGTRSVKLALPKAWLAERPLTQAALLEETAYWRAAGYELSVNESE